MKGTLEMDLIVAFLIILTMFIIMAKMSYEMGFITSKKNIAIANTIRAIKNSYIVLDNLRVDNKDNVIESTNMNDKIFLSGVEWELYGMNPAGGISKIDGNTDPRISKICINRGVYIKDLKMPGILKVCTEVKE